MHKFTKKRIAIGALGLLAVAGVAVAYFSTTGSGSGNAEVGTNTALTIKAEVSGKLYPGTSSPVTFKVTNPAGKGQQHVGTIELKEVKAYKTAGHTELKEPCNEEAKEHNWFTMTNVVANKVVPPNATEESLAGVEGNLEFQASAESQDACKEAFLVASFTSN